MRAPLIGMVLSMALAACGGDGASSSSDGGGGTSAGIGGGGLGGEGAGGEGGTVVVEEGPFEPPPEPTPLDMDAVDAIAADIDAILAGFPSQQHTVMVVGADTGQVIYERNPDLALKPASNTKLFSTAAAFARFGEDHRHTTRIYATAAPDNGVIAGDLLIVGNHDYTWSTQFYPSARWPLDRIAEQLAALGIIQVTGTVQARFAHLYDGYQFAYYNAAAHRGAVATNFANALSAAGIAHGGSSSSPDSDVPDGATELTSWASLPLHVSGSPINRISHNEFADILSHHLGWELGGTNSYGAGAVEMIDLLGEAGSDVTELAFFDGARAFPTTTACPPAISSTSTHPCASDPRGSPGSARSLSPASREPSAVAWVVRTRSVALPARRARSTGSSRSVACSITVMMASATSSRCS